MNEHAGARAAALCAAAAFLIVSSPPAVRAEDVEAFEIGTHNTSELPKGKEADGIRGDFVLRNAAVEALVSGNLPNRKANMGTDWNAPTPGSLYDLCVRGSNNDQLTHLAPGGLKGPVSYVRLLEPGETKLAPAAVRTYRSAASAGGHEEVHDYLLGEGWRYLAILSTYRNRSGSDWKVTPHAAWKELRDQKTVLGIRTGDATNPVDRQGYACITTPWSGKWEAKPPAPAEVVLKPGGAASFLTLVAPGRSPAEAFGVLAARRGPTGKLRARIHSGGKPVTSAALRVYFDGSVFLNAYTGPDGRLEIDLPPREYRLVVHDLGRDDVERRVTIKAGGAAEADFELPPPARVVVRVTEKGTGRPLPCKVQFIGIDGTPDPYLGVDDNARGCRNQYHSENGHFTQQLPPGRYRLVITRGIEYDHAERQIELAKGEEVHVAAELARVVDTTGWVSTDFHNHSTPSGDNYCGTDDRVINLAAEHVEFAPTTEHNRFYDWAPHIEKLGLSEHVRTVVGIELTGPNAHFNAFPLKVESFVQDNGAPTWQHDPRLNAIVLRDYQGGGPTRWVHLNHPHVGRFFRDRDADGVPDGGYAGLDRLIDAAEVWSLQILDPRLRIPYRDSRGRERTRENRTFAWLQLLNQGMRIWCIAVSDAHHVFGNGVGGWRTYVKSSIDEPAKLDPAEIIRNAKAGRMFVTTGPFLEVELDDGTPIGGSTISRGGVRVRVRVQCTTWIDIDRVQVLVNGRMEPSLNFTRASHPQLFGTGIVKFEHVIPVPLESDAHLIVAAVGERFNLKTGYGNSTQASWHPCAFTNPIYVDVDGHGFEPSGDNLGQPLPDGR